MILDWLRVVLILVFGLAVGSFINALVWRLRKRIPIGGKSRSICTSCRKQLEWYDLVPIVSWLILKAKCRFCKQKISSQYPIVELTNGLLWLISYIALQPSDLSSALVTIIWLFAVSILLALAVYDARWFELPDRLVFGFIVSAILITILQLNLSEISIYATFDPILGALFIAGLFYVLYSVSDGKWIGGGDVKLAIGMGILLGVSGSILALFLAAFAGSLYGLLGMLLFGRSRKDLIPFGPFLIGATVVSFLHGASIIDWYLSQFLY